MWVSQLGCTLSFPSEGSWNYWVLHKVWSLTPNFEGGFLSKTRSGIKTATLQPKVFLKHSFSAVYCLMSTPVWWAGGKGTEPPLSWTDSHVFVQIVDVDVLEEMLTKSSQVRQRDNSDNCFSGTQEKKITFIAPPTENPGVCLGLGIRFCSLWQTLGIFNKSKIVPAEKLKLELV